MSAARLPGQGWVSSLEGGDVPGVLVAQLSGIFRALVATVLSPQRLGQGERVRLQGIVRLVVRTAKDGPDTAGAPLICTDEATRDIRDTPLEPVLPVRLRQGASR